MIAKVLGIADIITAGAFFLSLLFKNFPSFLILGFGIYLLLKGIIFALLLDFASFVDIFCAIIILLSIPFTINTILASIVIIFLAQKGIFSIIS